MMPPNHTTANRGFAIMTDSTVRAAKIVSERLDVLRETMTPANCYRFIDEAITALEDARAVVEADSSEETRAALMMAHANAQALQLAMTPDMIMTDSVKFALLEAAMERLDELPSWEDPLLDRP
jgi:hypothetical protein